MPEARDKIYRSRHGYHPCSYETCRKLKDIVSGYFLALTRLYAWNRWHRKAPQNRVGVEPRLIQWFTAEADEPWIRETVRHNRHGRYTHREYLPKKVLGGYILDLYRAARRPSPEPPLPFGREIEEMVDMLWSLRGKWE